MNPDISDAEVFADLELWWERHESVMPSLTPVSVTPESVKPVKPKIDLEIASTWFFAIVICAECLLFAGYGLAMLGGWIVRHL
jgi:hypothetical protein